jgi:DNA-binding NarL/FixJ family response regulator
MQPAHPSAPIRIVLADDHEIVRSGVSALLSMIDGVEVIGEAADGRTLLELVAALHPDLVLTDISMPHVDGFAAIEQLAARHPDVRAVVLTMYDSVEVVKRAVAAGACGYVMKDSPRQELEQAIRAVHAQGSYFSPRIASRMLMPADAPGEPLTQRQSEILKLLVQGRSVKEIAFELGLSPKTVEVHRSRLMERVQVRDLSGLTRYAIRIGLIQP